MEAKPESPKHTVPRWSKAPGKSPWYSRSMALLGTLILLFLAVHTSKFWIPNRVNQIVHGEELPLYTMMVHKIPGSADCYYLYSGLFFFVLAFATWLPKRLSDPGLIKVEVHRPDPVLRRRFLRNRAAGPGHDPGIHVFRLDKIILPLSTPAIAKALF